ncbi:Calcium uniporter protein 4 mitochondrial [Zea mays]|uniref:Calcium uniporter protein 4 mitochondrial n=1 Tax=Zea mays TaxID=4577 RepID=A0A1D6KRF4_MAIZE|nr:Calcium uniporter protein 4 mitochondrial [Zea mays]
MAAVLRRAVAQCFASSSSSSPATFGLRRFLQEQPAFRPAVPPDRFMPLADRIRDLGVGVAFPRINLDGLVPPAPCRTPTSCASAATPPARTRAPPSRARSTSPDPSSCSERPSSSGPTWYDSRPPSPYLYTTAHFKSIHQLKCCLIPLQIFPLSSFCFCFCSYDLLKEKKTRWFLYFSLVC